MVDSRRGSTRLNLTYRKIQREALQLFTLTVAFLFLLAVAGTPFFTSIGRYDTADDTSYMAWTHAIGFNGDGKVKNEAHPGWTANNHHTWGTGLLLAPAMALTRLVAPENSGFNPWGYSLVNTMSILLGYLSVVGFFLAFRAFASPGVAGLCAFSTIAGTSLLKWVFVRNIFSHSPEAFVLSVGTLFFVRRYVLCERSRANWVGLMVCAALLVQIRREDVLFFPFIGWFESQTLGTWKRQALGLGALIGVMLLSIVLLQSSNLLTTDGNFFSVPTARDLRPFIQWPNAFRENFFDVMFGQKFGFFNIWSFFPFAALMGGWMLRKKPGVWLPAAALVAVVLGMCVVHAYPNGCEWQNRFTLKLNPVVFGGSAYVLSRLSIPWRWGAIILALGALAKQYWAYRLDLNWETPVYLDHMLGRAPFFQQTVGQPMALYYLPVIVIGVIAMGTVTFRWAAMMVQKSRARPI